MTGHRMADPDSGLSPRGHGLNFAAESRGTLSTGQGPLAKRPSARSGHPLHRMLEASKVSPTVSPTTRDRNGPAPSLGVRTRAALGGLLAVLLAVAFSGLDALAAESPDVTVQLELGGHAGAVRRIDVDPVRGIVATGSDDKSARLWSLSGGALRSVLRPPVGRNEAGRVYGVALNAQRGWLAVGGTSAIVGSAGPGIQIHDAETGEFLRRFDARGGDVKRLLWSPDGSALIAAYAGEHGVRAFDIDGSQTFADPFDGGVYALAVGPGILAAASLDGSLRVYRDQGTGARPRYVEQWRRQVAANPVSLALSPDGGALAIGYYSPGKAPDVVDMRTQRLTQGVAPPALGRETLMSVAWTGDGKRVVAAGDYGYGRRNTRLVVAEPGARSMDELDSGAASTITDLHALPDGRYAWASADGSWGVLDLPGRKSQPVRADLPDLDGAGNLRVGGDGQRLSWTLDGGGNPVEFDFSQRVVANGRGTAVEPPLLRRGLLDAPSDWENHRTPQVNGARIALAADEVSRAAVLFANGPDAILGTSRALWRIGVGGATVWRRQTQTEVRAVNLARGGRVVVAAMLDGTVHLYRASDGEELLALLVLRDRRWVMWTPDGYFDAAVGADRLVGWVVNRPDGSAADYYPVAQFRERFHQPRYIDLLLQTLDAAEASRRHAAEVALELGPEATKALASRLPPASVTGSDPLAPLRLPPPQQPALAVAMSLPPPLAVLLMPQALPPVLQSSWRTIEFVVPAAPAEVVVDIPVSVRSHDLGLAFEWRIDGRPGGEVAAALERASDGLLSGRVKIQIPADAASVQLLARDRNGLSEPWVLAVRPRPAPLASLQSTLPAPSASVGPLVPSGTVSGMAADTSARLTQPAPTLALIAPASAAAVGGRLFVLAVGISDYARPAYRLRLAAKDAGDFAQAIRAQQSKLYREVVVRQLLDREASRPNLLAALKWLAQQGGKGDTYMLFMAGHGANGPSGSYYFLTADAHHEDLRGTALSDGEIRQALRRIPGRALMFIDTCHAGNALGSTTARHSEVARFVNDLSDNGVVVFAASSGRQESLESDAWGNGAFTLALIDGLGGKADPLRIGRVTYKGLDYYVSESVRRLTKGEQTPVSLAPIGVPDFELARL